jgi:hypothetical protein
VGLKLGIVKLKTGETFTLLNVSVCYDISVGYSIEIPHHIGVIPPKALVTIHGKEYLYGAIAYHKEVGKYKIEFEHSHLKSSFMDSEGAIYGMKLASELKNDCMVQDNLVESVRCAKGCI